MVESGDHIGELIGPYVLGALEPDEVEDIELHLLWCDECRELVEEQRQVVGLLPYLAEPQPVPLRARRQLRDRIESEFLTPADSGSLSRFPVLIQRFRWAAVGVAAALVLAVFGWSTFQMQAEVEKKDDEVAMVQQQQDRMFEFIKNGGRFVNLQGTGVAPAATGSIILNPINNTALLLVDGIAKPPPEQNYVVWLVKGARHLNSGVLPVDDQGKGQLYITANETLLSFDSIVITEESGPLVANPTGVRLMAARVGD